MHYSIICLQTIYNGNQTANREKIFKVNFSEIWKLTKGL